MEMLDFKLPFISKWKNDIIHLIYPSTCLICDKELPNQYKHICTFCSSEFNYTFFERYNEATALDQLFWGIALMRICFLKKAKALSLFYMH